MHAYILNTSKRCTFWICNCPQNQLLTMPLCWHYIQNKCAQVLSPTHFLAWYGLNKVFINQAEGTVNRVWHIQFPMAIVVHYSTCALLVLSWTANAFFAVWIFLVENVCIEYNHVQAMHKEFLWPFDTFTQKTVVL